MSRRPAIAKVQIARKELGLDDETYRAMLERLTGRTSSADCTDAQLGRVIDEMKSKGWSPKLAASKPTPRKAKPALADHPVARKARAMWISLHQLGVVRDPSEAALEAFGRRQLGVDRLRWARQSEGHRLIEALKAMAERAGWAQDLGKGYEGWETLALKRRLFAAQEIVLGRLEPGRLSEVDLAQVVSESDLDERIVENGRHITAHPRPVVEAG